MQDKSVEFNALMGSLTARALVELLVERGVINTTDAVTIYSEVQKTSRQLGSLEVHAAAGAQIRDFQRRSQSN